MTNIHRLRRHRQFPVSAGEIGEYLRSPLAHNTYTIGDEYVEARKLPELKADIRSVETGAFGAELTGFTERFSVKAGVQRKITVNPEFSTLSIEDRLYAAGSADSAVREVRR